LTTLRDNEKAIYSDSALTDKTSLITGASVLFIDKRIHTFAANKLNVYDMKTKNHIVKMVLFTGLFLLSRVALSQGNVNSIQIIPSNPTTLDDISIVGDVTINSASCPIVNISCFQNGSFIEVNAYHCFGMLPMLCDSYDTCSMSPLAPNLYTVVFYLWTGSPCPGPGTFVCNDTAYETFLVTPVSDVSENSQKAEILIYPNPGEGDLFLINNTDDGELLIFSAEGRMLEKHSFVSGKNEFSLDLAQGMYLAVFHKRNSYSAATPLSIVR
jgi:hypothetical protein